MAQIVAIHGIAQQFGGSTSSRRAGYLPFGPV